mgnify:CR=1 FL=1
MGSAFIQQVHEGEVGEDAAQEVFLRLYRSRHRYQPRARFATWVFHITQNVARNALRFREGMLDAARAYRDAVNLDQDFALARFELARLLAAGNAFADAEAELPRIELGRGR